MSVRGWLGRIWYQLVRRSAMVGLVLFFRLRWRGRANIPRSGPLLVLANHQSHLDPVLVGVAISRPLGFVARKTLFDNKFLSWLMRSLGAFPLDRDRGGGEGLKETMRRLKRGEAVLIFPEGTRSPDGEVQPLKPGFAAIARRCGAALLPVGLDGAYEAWPRDKRFPRPGRVAVVIGSPLSPESLAELDEREIIEQVHQRIVECHADARARRRSSRRQIIDESPHGVKE